MELQKLPRTYYASWEVYNCLDGNEYAALSADWKNALNVIYSLYIVDMSDGKNAKTVFWAAFPDGSKTRANLTVLLET